jgi:two-component system OmpR family response regulator
MGEPVLVVDDDEIIRHIIQDALESEGFVVQTASDGSEALDAARHYRPSIVLLDLHFPIYGGKEIARLFNLRFTPPVPIVTITADEHADEAARSMRAVAFLRKPFDVDELLRTVRRVLSRTASQVPADGAR